MFLLLSGEGKSDIGVCSLALEACDEDCFQPGPMSWIVDRLVENSGFKFSPIDSKCVGFVTKSYLVANKPPPTQKVNFPGKKKPQETHYYFANAKALAIAANTKMSQANDVVIAVLFRDADGTASANRGEWADKIKSIQAGFADADFDYGIAMMPKPKSEAWLLCALKKDNPYQHCQQLEDCSGNDHSPRALKDQLSDTLNGLVSTEQLNELVRNEDFDISQIDMCSFNTFKTHLDEVVKKALRWKAVEQ